MFTFHFVQLILLSVSSLEKFAAFRSISRAVIVQSV